MRKIQKYNPMFKNRKNDLKNNNNEHFSLKLNKY